jgi:hypothetical protein
MRLCALADSPPLRLSPPRWLSSGGTPDSAISARTNKKCRNRIVAAPSLPRTCWLPLRSSPRYSLRCHALLDPARRTPRLGAPSKQLNLDWVLHAVCRLSRRLALRQGPRFMSAGDFRRDAHTSTATAPAISFNCQLSRLFPSLQLVGAGLVPLQQPVAQNHTPPISDLGGLEPGLSYVPPRFPGSCGVSEPSHPPSSPVGIWQPSVTFALHSTATLRVLN